VTLKLAVSRSRPPVLYGANFLTLIIAVNKGVWHSDGAVGWDTAAP